MSFEIPSASQTITSALAVALFSAAALAAPVPAGLDTFLVFMANGTIPAGELLLEPGTEFQTEVMGRNETEIELLRQDAIDFLGDRFGLDVELLVAEGRATFESYTTSSLFDYRAHVVRGVPSLPIPARGLPVREGTFILIVTDPEGVVLGGELVGTHVPVGTAFGTGEYNVLLGPGRELVIPFQSLGPAIPGDQQLCELLHPELGRGLAIVSSYLQVGDDGALKVNARNVLTFPFPELP